MSLSNEAIKSIMSQRTATTLNTLITIDLKDGTKFNFCDGKQSIVYAGVTYYAASFQFDPPDEQRDTQVNAALTITVIDQTVPDAVLDISGDALPIITAHTVIDTHTGAAESGTFWSFQLSGCSWTGLALTAELSFGDCLNQAIPARKFDSIYCPGSYA